jgi:aspartate/methionine/tyrosine aminotransferase
MTSEQRESLRSAVYDLSIGYPSFVPLDDVDAHLDLWSRQALLGGNRSSKVGGESEELHRLFSTISQLLRAPAVLSSRMEMTFSGSIAIQRAIVALQLLSSRNNKRPVFVLIEPSIDIYRSMLHEHGVNYVVINRLAMGNDFDMSDAVSVAIRELTSSNSDVLPVVLFDSPSNPLGEVVDSETLRRLGEVVASSDGCLVVDHCFALAGVHDSKHIDLVFHEQDFPCEWMAIWDTGKTFNLNGDKFAILAASNDELLAAIRHSLETIQVSPSPKDVSFFSQFLSHPLSGELIGRLHLETIANLNFLLEQQFEFISEAPAGGTFACLSLPSGVGSTAFRRRSLSNGVAIASGVSFQSMNPDDPSFIRLSLARPQEVFTEAMSRLELQT